MEEILDQIEQAMETSHANYLALAGAPIVPDLCAALEDPDGRTTSDLYKSWFDANVDEHFEGRVTGDDCWRFRCEVLHRGTAQMPKWWYKRVFFVEGQIGNEGGTWRRVRVDDYGLHLHIRFFCGTMVSSARAWLDRVRDTDVFRANYDQLMRRRYFEIEPYTGMGVIT